MFWRVAFGFLVVCALVLVCLAIMAVHLAHRGRSLDVYVHDTYLVVSIYHILGLLFLALVLVLVGGLVIWKTKLPH